MKLVILDYMSAQIMYFEYFIGGSFDGVVVDWKWVNGSIIDPNFLMNYPVAGGPGACLIWSDIHYLYDYPCSVSIPAICDIPMTTSSGEIQKRIYCIINQNQSYNDDKYYRYPVFFFRFNKFSLTIRYIIHIVLHGFESDIHTYLLRGVRMLKAPRDKCVIIVAREHM